MITSILFTGLFILTGNVSNNYEVSVKGQVNQIATKMYNDCKEKIKSEGKYSCKNMLLTMMQESGFNPRAKSKTNDYGIFQLHYTYHKAFINSKKFASSDEQINYGINLWVNASKKNSMPRYGYKVKNKRNKIIKIARINS